jgi:hypothetical protein
VNPVHEWFIVPVVTFHVHTQAVERTWEVHQPLGSKVATFMTYPGACKYVKAQTGKRYVQASLAPARKTT